MTRVMNACSVELVAGNRWPGLLLQTAFYQCCKTTKVNFMVLGHVNRTVWGTKLLLTAVWASLVDCTGSRHLLKAQHCSLSPNGCFTPPSAPHPSPPPTLSPSHPPTPLGTSLFCFFSLLFFFLAILFFLPIMLNILLEVAIFCSKLCYKIHVLNDLLECIIEF